MGSIINAAAIVAVAAMVIWFGVRPGLKMALPPPQAAETDAALGDFSAQMAPLPGPDGEGQLGSGFLIASDPAQDDEFLQAIAARRDNGPERKLQKLIDFDENHAGTILKQGIRQGANG
jgi:flagellar M-ring protein FliF